MYSVFKSLLLKVFKTPSGPPEPPAGNQHSVQTFRASPKFLKYQLLSFFIKQIYGLVIAVFFAGGMIAAAFDSDNGSWAISSIAVIVICFAIFSVLLRYFLVRIDYDLRYYILTDRSLRIRQGAWRINESTFTFANIQNLTIQQGPLERFLGISNLYIETAGGGGGAAPQQNVAARMMHKGVLRGIDNAEEMRDRIMTLLKNYRDAGLGDDKAKRSAVVTPTMGSGLPPQTIPLLRQIRDEATRLAWASRGKG